MNAIAHSLTCSCGERRDHMVAHRTTVDGVLVYLWSDGAITGVLGIGLRGVPMRRPTTIEKHAQAMRAGRLLLGEACITDAADLGRVYAACERVARKHGLPGDVRKLLATRAAPVKLVWSVVSTDRDGKPTERMAHLPRLRWPGLALVDFCGGPGSADGRYVLFNVNRGVRPGTRVVDEWMTPTGFAFRTLDALWRHLERA